MRVCVNMCVCLCKRVFYVCNAMRQLNLLPLITRILQPRKKTHPISCDTAVTSCRAVFMDAVPVTLLISWFVCVSETDRVHRLAGCFAASALTSWLPRQGWDSICLHSQRGLRAMCVWFNKTKTKCSDQDRKMWGLGPFVQTSTPH